MSKDTTIDFIVTLQKGKLDELEAIRLENDCNGVEKHFKLCSTNTTTNMHLFDANDKLKKYANVVEIIDDYFETRLQLFQVRKSYLIDALTKELLLLSNKSRYIKENLDDTIDLRKKKRDEVIQMLVSKGYDIMDNDDEYKYLTRMPMDSVTEENVSKLLKEHADKSAELEMIQSITIHQMWLNELNKLEEEYNRFKEDRKRVMSGETATKKKIVKVVKKAKLLVSEV